MVSPNVASRIKMFMCACLFLVLSFMALGADAQDRDSRNGNPDRQQRLAEYWRYCKDQGYKQIPLISDCAEEQADAFSFVFDLMTTAQIGSEQSKKITQCYSRYHNKATGILDAKMAKLCYTLP